MRFKRGQVTIFIIIAIMIVAVAVLFFVFREGAEEETLPASLDPVYTAFQSCLKDDILVGIGILESQAGYIYLPDFEPGSDYSPFGSQLNFFGNPIPYWYYLSRNNLPEQQVPSKEFMESELEKFIQEKIRNCNYDSFYLNGYEIEQGEPVADVTINENSVEVSLDMPLSLVKSGDSASVSEHQISVKSSLGKLYDSAIAVYEKEQNELFLEKYGVDVLRLYAPVDGVELTCSPLVWNAESVFDNLQEAIEANTLALRGEANEYSLRTKENKYFVVDLGVDEEVRFINSQDWAYSFEVNPSEGAIMMASPVGNQPGLGVLGFCYVTYHFVYNINYPVLVQISDGAEFFQFPVAVVIRGNMPREAVEAETIAGPDTEMCQYKNTLMDVRVYDKRRNPLDANISFECFGTTCQIGETENGAIEAEFPQCYNAFITAKAEGYEEAEYIYSTVQPGTAEIILDKLYKERVDLRMDGKIYDGSAIIIFTKDDGTARTVVYPDQKNIELSEGQYTIQVYIYRNSSLKIEESTREQCISVPRTGIGGLFGFTEKKCFDVTFPEQIVSNALAGGGTEDYYIVESELSEGGIVEIDAESLPTPDTLEKLQENYILFDDNELDITFK